MIEPLIQLGEWINQTDYAPLLGIALVLGMLHPRAGFGWLTIWFLSAWLFV
jgi:hypothetical protein